MIGQSSLKTKTYTSPKRILLIEPPNNLVVGFNATVVVEPLGLQYLAGNLLDIAEVKIFDMRVDPTPLGTEIESFKPDLVGIKEGYTVDVGSVKGLAKDIKTLSPDITVVVGGHHVSLAPKDAFTPNIDVIVIGDGERIFRNLIVNMQNGEGVSTTPGTIFQTPDGEFNESNVGPMTKSSLKEYDSKVMNERPLPARHMVDHYRDKYFFLYHTRPYSVEMARGCIYRCNFCSVHEFHKGEYRVQGSDRTVNELVNLPRNSWINIVDDLAIQEVPRSLKMLYPPGFDPMDDLADRLIDLDLGQRYWMQVRADNVVRNPKKFEKWAKAGLDTVLVGLESFEQGDLNSVSKGTRVGDNEKCIDILHSLGIRIWGAVIVFQNWVDKNFDNLKEKVYQNKIEYPNYTILTPLPGTGQWKDMHDKIITKDPKFFDFLHSVLPTNLRHDTFYEQYASLWRTVGDGGLGRLRKMMKEVSTTRGSVIKFLRQYKTLSDVETYRGGIDLLEKANAERDTSS